MIDEEFEAELTADDESDWDSDEQLGTDFIVAAEPPDTSTR